MKPCIKCGKSDRYKSGDCRPCYLEYARKWRVANPGKAAARKRKYYYANRDKMLAYSREYYAANRENMLVAQRKWVSANPEKVAAYQREWREVNKEKRAAYWREWEAANPEKVAAYKRKYKRANPEKAIEHDHKRRARKNKNGGNLTATDIRAIYVVYPACLACGASENLSLDHVIPIAKGGKNSIENIQVLCISCNCSKSTKTIDYRSPTT